MSTAGSSAVTVKWKLMEWTISRSAVSTTTGLTFWEAQFVKAAHECSNTGDCFAAWSCFQGLQSPRYIRLVFYVNTVKGHVTCIASRVHCVDSTYLQISLPHFPKHKQFWHEGSWFVSNSCWISLHRSPLTCTYIHHSCLPVFHSHLASSKANKTSRSSLAMLSCDSITPLAAAVPLSHPLWPKNVARGFELEKPNEGHSLSILARAFS